MRSLCQPSVTTSCRTGQLQTRVHAAAAALPDCTEALAVVTLVGALGAAEWPGLTLAPVGAR